MRAAIMAVHRCLGICLTLHGAPAPPTISRFTFMHTCMQCTSFHEHPLTAPRPAHVSAVPAQAQDAIPKTATAVVDFVGLKDVGKNPATIFAPTDEVRCARGGHSRGALDCASAMMPTCCAPTDPVISQR